MVKAIREFESHRLRHHLETAPACGAVFTSQPPSSLGWQNDFSNPLVDRLGDLLVGMSQQLAGMF